MTRQDLVQRVRKQAAARKVTLARQRAAWVRKALEQQQARLEGLAAAVQRGQLNNSSFLPGDATLQPGGRSGSGAGLEAGGVTNLVGDLIEVEKQLAEAEATYTDAAPQVQELRAKRNKLRPLLQRRQMEAIQSSLSENQAQLTAIQRQQNQLAGRFMGNPAQM